MAKHKLKPRMVKQGGALCPARIPRQPGLDVTARPNEGWPRYAILADGEELERTPYITNLIRRGDLVPVEAQATASSAKPAELEQPELEQPELEQPQLQPGAELEQLED